MGRVLAVFKGSDSLVRVADVTIGHKTYRCPVHKLVIFLGKMMQLPLRGSMLRPPNANSLDSLTLFLFTCMSLLHIWTCHI